MADRTVSELVAAARGGELRATARLLTFVERGGDLAEQVAEASDPTTNLMPALMEAVRARTTIGEIIEALEGVFGTYVEQAVI